MAPEQDKENQFQELYVSGPISFTILSSPEFLNVTIPPIPSLNPISIAFSASLNFL